MTGFAAASAVADWAITIDADGQHYPEDARKLIKAIPKKKRQSSWEQEPVCPANMSLDKQFRAEVFQLLGAYFGRPRHF